MALCGSSTELTTMDMVITATMDMMITATEETKAKKTTIIEFYDLTLRTKFKRIGPYKALIEMIYLSFIYGPQF